MSGNFIGQAVTFLAYPLLTRIYSEADFGVFATYMSICSLTAIVATGRYEEALLIAGDRNETVSILGFSIKWLTLFSALIFTALALFRRQIFGLLKYDGLENVWYYIPVSIFMMGLTAMANNLAVREMKFKTVARSGVAQNLTNTASKLGFGFAGLTGLGLVASNVTALLSAIISYLPLKKYFLKALTHSRWRDEKAAAAIHSDFPKYNLVRNITASFAVNLPFLYLAGFFMPEQSGLLALAAFAVSAPVNLVTGSLFFTFSNKITLLKREGKPIMPFVKTYWKGLLMFVLPTFAVVFIIARPMFGFIFGQQWEASGIYFRMMLPWMFMLMATNPVYTIFMVFKKQQKTLYIELAGLALRLTALFTGIIKHDFNLSVMLFYASGFLITSISFIWIYSIIRRYETTTE
jgi:O-antigen/teichoic acid export membrane protein